MKIIYIFAGIVFILIGLIGLVLPIVPTMPFLFFALLCFMKASERFKKWVRELKLYKKFFRRFEKIPKKQKTLLCIAGAALFCAVISALGCILWFLKDSGILDFSEIINSIKYLIE